MSRQLHPKPFLEFPQSRRQQHAGKPAGNQTDEQGKCRYHNNLGRSHRSRLNAGQEIRENIQLLKIHVHVTLPALSTLPYWQFF
jgi:hypothetical protein